MAALVVAYSDYNRLRRLLGRNEVRRSRVSKGDGALLGTVRFLVFILLIVLIAPLNAGPELWP